jgi:hypothetical protein
VNVECLRQIILDCDDSDFADVLEALPNLLAVYEAASVLVDMEREYNSGQRDLAADDAPLARAGEALHDAIDASRKGQP